MSARGQLVIQRSMWHVIVLAVVAIAACAGRKSKAVVEHGCTLATDPHTETIAWVGDDAIHVQQGKQRKKFRFSDEPCLKFGKDADALAVLPGGQTVVVAGTRATGGSIHHHVEHETAVSCQLDVSNGTVTELDIGEIGHRTHHQQWAVGPRSGLIYSFKIGRGPTLINVERKQVWELGSKRSECVVAERDQTARIACAWYESKPSVVAGTPAYDHGVDVFDLDVASWPPTLTGEQRIQADGRVDQVAISPSGRFIGFASNTPGLANVGLIDDGTIAFEQTTLVGRPALVQDNGQMLIAEHDRSDFTLLDQRGKQIGHAKNPASRDNRGYDVHRLSSSNFLYGSCRWYATSVPAPR